MILNPRIGQAVRCHYAKRFAHLWPLHGKTGIVRFVGKGQPRNHGIEIDGRIVIVPSGNLVPERKSS